jgi:sulfite exporter TauE/SafE
MIELPLVLLGGLLGSSHCIGMCGGFAVAVGATANGWKQNVRRQAVYSTGRVLTYASLGAIAGFAGLRLSQEMTWLVNVQSGLAIIAGILLIIQGTLATGVIRTPFVRLKPVACLAGSAFSELLRSRSVASTFALGVATGFMPCGLVYAYLTLAASTGSLTRGGLTMAVFGLGTAPLMIATGAGAALLRLSARRRLLRVAACCVVLMGLLSLARGIGFLNLRGSPGAGGCPACGDDLTTLR